MYFITLCYFAMNFVFLNGEKNNHKVTLRFSRRLTKVTINQVRKS